MSDAGFCLLSGDENLSDIKKIVFLNVAGQQVNYSADLLAQVNCKYSAEIQNIHQYIQEVNRVCYLLRDAPGKFWVDTFYHPSYDQRDKIFFIRYLGDATEIVGVALAENVYDMSRNEILRIAHSQFNFPENNIDLHAIGFKINDSANRSSFSETKPVPHKHSASKAEAPQNTSKPIRKTVKSAAVIIHPTSHKKPSVKKSKNNSQSQTYATKGAFDSSGKRRILIRG